MNDQAQTPYFDALREYVETEVLTFHTPGHQQGKGADPEFARFIAEHGLRADITQVLGMDDILRPETVCKQAQQLAARAYGAEHTYFLVNGSTSGNHAMLLATLRPDEVILIPRNSHRSLMGALILTGARPVYYEAEFDEEMGVAHTPTPASVRAVCSAHPEARALFFTSPTYYGAGADVRSLVEIGHAHGLVVLVDEAWGPHLHFHPDFPTSAVDAGADLVVQSTHKLLAAMSQASMLHLNGSRVERGRLESVLKILLSTSPSCLLVASLDVARQQMSLHGRELFEVVLNLARQLRQDLNEISGLRCYGAELSQRSGVHGWDPTRLVITGQQLGWSGYEIEKFLRYRHNLQIEMSEYANVVVLLTLGHTRADTDRLLQGFRALAREQPPESKPISLKSLRRLPLPRAALSLRQAFDAAYETLPLQEAPGRISVELVTPYPPGIPVLCPGEIVSQELIDYLGIQLAAGVRIQGPFDQELNTIRVVA